MSGRPAEVPGSGDDRARERLAAVGYIASLIGHEARNRLANLRAALELIHAGLEAHLSPEYRAALLRELEEFIGDFNLGLDMVRSDWGAAGPASVRDLVTEVLEEAKPRAARAGVRLAPVLGHATDEIRTDRRLLRITLLNLLRNALEALAGQADGRIEVRTTDAPGWLHLEVEDNGRGVPPDLRERIFLRLDTRDGAGAGLGLSLCRDAMVVLGGSVTLVTAPGQLGACFRISIPSGV
jgi:two-component system, NtrC family, C4-dicarboxylate transport sensor histidine kinase DctB